MGADARVTFGWEPLDRLLADGFEDLLVAHWNEVAADKDVVPLAVDWDEYRALEKMGRLKILAMREAGAFVGYNAFFVNKHMHYKTTLHALNDVIYLDPAYRGAGGVRLILTAENLLREMGVVKVLYHTKIGLRLASETGSDSLEAVETIIELEEEFGVKLPDDLFGGVEATMGDLLARLGYTAIEEVHGKILRG